MIPLTIEKLKRDSRRLEHNIQRMKKKGRNDAASRLKSKKALIDAQLINLVEEAYHPSYYEVYNAPYYSPPNFQ